MQLFLQIVGVLNCTSLWLLWGRKFKLLLAYLYLHTPKIIVTGIIVMISAAASVFPHCDFSIIFTMVYVPWVVRQVINTVHIVDVVYATKKQLYMRLMILSRTDQLLLPREVRSQSSCDGARSSGHEVALHTCVHWPEESSLQLMWGSTRSFRD